MGQVMYRIALTLHVLSAVVWVGGVLFVGTVAVPVAKGYSPRVRRRLMADVGRRFRAIGWGALAVVVATGGYLLWHWGARPSTLIDLSFFEHDHTRLLGYKLILVVGMLFTSGLHDFWLGPRASVGERSDDQRERDRKLASILGRLTGVLVILIVILAVFVARPHA